MSAAYSLDVGELTTQTCGANGCGIAFAMPTPLYNKRRQDGGAFYCPNGHSLVFVDPENVRLKRELAQTQKRLEWKQQESDRHREEANRLEKCRRATKGALTKVKQRVARGCCPFCSATFPNLAAHVEAEHGSAPQAP